MTDVPTELAYAHMQVVTWLQVSDHTAHQTWKAAIVASGECEAAFNELANLLHRSSQKLSCPLTGKRTRLK